jgi:TonB family protein
VGRAAEAASERGHQCGSIRASSTGPSARHCIGGRRGRQASTHSTIAVVLDTIVLADGSVQVVRVARGIGFGLDERAVAAVLQWKFKPAHMNGKPVPVALNVEVSFNLR